MSASLTLPSPPGTPISTTDAGGAAGFNGLSDWESFNSGTGAYQGTQRAHEPSDLAMCAGAGYVIEGVNTAFAVYRARSPFTQVAAPTPYNEFYNKEPETLPDGTHGDRLGDPKCYFDPVGQRFIQTMVWVEAPGALDGSDRAHVVIAVSATANPAGSWNLFSIDTTDDGKDGTPAHTGCPCYADQPLLGANADSLFISTNEFELAPANQPFAGAQIYGLGLRALESASSGSSPPFVQIPVGQQVPTGDPNFPVWGSIQPSFSPAPSAGTELLMSSGPQSMTQELAPLDNRLAVWSLTGTGSLNTTSPQLTLQHQVLTSETYGLVTNTGAVQKAGPTPLRDSQGDVDPIEELNADDARMYQVEDLNGELYGDLSTTVTAAGQPDRVGVAYFGVAAGVNSSGKLNAAIASQGYLAAAGESNSLTYPSIAKTTEGTGVMSFTLSGPDYYPSAAFIQFNGQNPSGVIHVNGLGVLPEDGISGYASLGDPGGNPGVARWGDYSAAVAVDRTLFMGAGYIPDGPRPANGDWGTFIMSQSPSLSG